MADYTPVSVELTDEEAVASLGFANEARQVSGVLKGDGEGGVAEQPVDTTATQGSTNLITGGGAYAAAHATKPISEGGTGATNAGAGLYALVNGSAALTAANLADGDYLPVGDVSARTGKKMTVAELRKAVGGGLLPQLVVTTTAGATVTAKSGTTTLTATADAQGVATFEIPSYGTWTITVKHATEGQKTVTVKINSVRIYEIPIVIRTYIFSSSSPDVSKWVASSAYPATVGPNSYTQPVVPPAVSVTSYGTSSNQMYVLQNSAANASRPLAIGCNYYSELLDLADINTLHVLVTANCPSGIANTHYSFGISGSQPVAGTSFTEMASAYLIKYGTAQYGDLPYTGDLTLDVSSLANGYLWIGGSRDTRNNYVQIYIDAIWGE